MSQNGLHLIEIGKSCLANNFIDFVNRYILWYEETCNDSDNCLINVAEEISTDPKENKPVRQKTVSFV